MINFNQNRCLKWSKRGYFIDKIIDEVLFLFYFIFQNKDLGLDPITSWVRFVIGLTDRLFIDPN